MHQVIERIILKGHVMHTRGGFHALGEIGKVHERQAVVGGIVGIPAKRADLGIGVNTDQRCIEIAHLLKSVRFQIDMMQARGNNNFIEGLLLYRTRLTLFCHRVVPFVC